jgi:NAD(P)-dependent dehydrogenase (short-subunit alcohol dehydrogenase family)
MPATGAGSRFDLSGRVVLVTGASSGLGAHFAKVLDHAGATVVLAARRENRLSDVASTLTRASHVSGDLSNPDERTRLMATVMERHGRIDVLVNNAGLSRVAPLRDESLADFRSVLELNVTAPWHLAKLAAASMNAAGAGSIVNVASILGLVGSYPIAQANYAASKGALVNMTRELALQLAGSGVRVNALCPGWFPTEMTSVMQDESSQRFIRRNTPIGRMGRLAELDGALLLLASDAGSFFTGLALVVDGGWSAH